MIPPPDRQNALDTAGAIIHYVTSSRARLADFIAWTEHCPGDLDPMETVGFLSACHDLVAPGCPDAIFPPAAGEEPPPAPRCADGCGYPVASAGQVCGECAEAEDCQP